LRRPATLEEAGEIRAGDGVGTLDLDEGPAVELAGRRRVVPWAAKREDAARAAAEWRADLLVGIVEEDGVDVVEGVEAARRGGQAAIHVVDLRPAGTLPCRQCGLVLTVAAVREPLLGC